MNIEHRSDRLSIHFDHPVIKTLEYDPEGMLTVIDQDGRVVNAFKTPASVAFNRQYGTPISQDGKYVLIGVWEKGLFCYSIADGRLVWKQGPGKVRKILIFETELIVEMCDRGIYRRRIVDGSISQIIPMSAIDVFYRIRENELFAGPKYNKVFLYELPSLKASGYISMRELNLRNCLSFVITEARYEGKDLVIRGFENYAGGDYSKNQQVNFERIVHRWHPITASG